MLLDCPSPYFGLLVYWFLWLLFSTGLPTITMGSPLRGRGLLVLDRNEGLVSPFGSGTLVGSWLVIPPLVCRYLRAMSRCVAWWSSMCPYRWVTLSSLQGSSQSLVRGLGCLSSPTLFSAGWGWCLGRLLSFAPCCRLCPLSGCTSLILCAPLAVVCFQVHLTDSVPCL